MSRPLPTPPPDPRLDELFARYWENALGDAEAAELDRRLAADPAARDWFRFLSLQAAVAAEGSAVTRAVPPAPARWSRRRVLRSAGAGLAAGVAAVVVGRQVGADAAEPVRLAEARGEVEVWDEGSRTRVDAPFVPPGGTVTTRGAGSSAVLAYADGTAVALAGDSALTVAATGRRLQLWRGHATADVRPPSAALALVTSVATLTRLGGAVTTLGHAARATEVCVHQGRVTVTDPDGDQLAVVGAGERLTVRAGGCRKQPLTQAPDEYAWDLTCPLPDGWAVGAREETPDGPVVVPEHWPDPYYGGTWMYQIRSHQPWATGFFRLHPDSVVRVRYRAQRGGPGQVCFCARTADPRRPDTGMFEYNGGFEATAGNWRWIEARAPDMFMNKHAPKFGPPWVGFLVIVNTFEIDLGMEVAEFRVTRPGGAGR